MPLPGLRRNRNRVPSPFKGGSLFDEFFQELENGFFGGSLGRFGNTDIYEKDGSLHYELELPGLKKEDIKIRATEDSLVITGKVEQEEEEEDLNYISRGRRYGRFRRTLPLPEEVENPDELKAKIENGILYIEAELSESITEGEVIDVEIE